MYKDFIKLIVMVVLVVGPICWFFYNRCTDENYFGTDDGTYHHTYCLGCSESNVDNYFESEEEAIEAGYEPCSWCM